MARPADPAAYEWPPEAAAELADELARADRDAVLLWLRHTGARDRCQLAARILHQSVLAQARLLGVLA